MTLFWIIAIPFVFLLAVITIVDVFRRDHGGWATAGWVALIVILPLVGPLIYWVTRRPTRDDAEGQYLADADRREAGRRSSGGSF